MVKKKQVKDPLAGYISTSTFPDVGQRYDAPTEFQRQTFLLLKKGINVFLSPSDLQTTVISGGIPAINTTATVYTCPVGKVAYITSVSFSAIANSTSVAPGSTASGQLLVSGVGLITIGLNAIGQTVNQAISFPVPLVLRAGDRVQVISNDARITSYGGCTASEFSLT